MPNNLDFYKTLLRARPQRENLRQTLVMYSSGMTDEQWEIVQKHFPAGKRAGRFRVRSARDMINAIFYVQATGCQWCALPKDFPPCKQVCNTFARWRQRGVWNELLALLRQQVRCPRRAGAPGPA